MAPSPSAAWPDSSTNSGILKREHEDFEGEALALYRNYGIDEKSPTGLLSDEPLEWMLQKAETAGLEFDRQMLHDKYHFRTDKVGDAHNSRKGFFAIRNKLHGDLPRAFPAKPELDTQESIHESARRHFAEDPHPDLWPQSFRDALS